MKLFSYLLVITCGLFLASCGGDDCAQADWLGTYTLDTASIESNCEALFTDTTLTVTAGADATTILINGSEWTLDNCEVGESVLGVGIQYTLNGNTIDFLNGTCNADYTK